MTRVEASNAPTGADALQRRAPTCSLAHETQFREGNREGGTTECMQDFCRVMLAGVIIDTQTEQPPA